MGDNTENTDGEQTENPSENKDLLPALDLERRTLMKTLTVAGASASGLGALAGEVAAAILCVDPNDGNCYDTIQGAVNDASPGDLIEVAESEYNETVRIDRALTLRGAPGDPEITGADSDAPILDGSGLDGNAFFIQDGVSNVTIEGFEIQNYSASSNRGLGHGIASNEQISNITVRNNSVHDIEETGVVLLVDEGDAVVENISVIKNSIESFGAFGIRIGNAVDSTVRGNVIHGQGGFKDPFEGGISELGILIQAQRRFDIENEVVADSIDVENNEVEGPFDFAGIIFGANNKNKESKPVKLTNIRAADNTVSNSDFGIVFIANNEGIVDGGIAERNQVSDCERFGISVVAGFGGSEFGSFEIKDNSVSRNQFGIGTSDVGEANIAVVDNEATDNEFGLLISGITDGSMDVRENILQNNMRGVDIRFTSPDLVTINQNDIFGNSEWGVINNRSQTVDATNNWWGAENGPSGGVEDPVTGERADGDGDKVSEDVNFDPWLGSPVQVSNLELQDVGLVQTVERTVIDGDSEDSFEEPFETINIAGVPTTAVFGISGENINTLSDPIEFKYQIKKESDNSFTNWGTYILSPSEVKSLIDKWEAGEIAELRRFLFAYAGNDLPTRELERSLTEVRVSLQPSNRSNSTDGDQVEISLPSEIPPMPDLNIGFAEIRDPGGGSRYGSDGSGGAENFDESVSEIISYVRNNYPTPNVKSHVHQNIDGNTTRRFDVKKDMKKARDVLEGDLDNGDVDGSISRFDVTVAIVPDGYFDYHLYPNDTEGTHFGDEDSHPQASAAVLELGGKNGQVKEEDVASTGAHEMGHHFLPNPAYPKVMARRYQNELGQEKIDQNHVRFNQKIDPPHVESIGYDLSSKSVKQNYPSFMSYSGTEEWIDAFTHKTLVDLSANDNKWELGVPETNSDDPTVLSGWGELNDEGEAVLTRMWKREGFPMRSQQDNEVQISLQSVSGEEIENYKIFSTTKSIVDSSTQGSGVEEEKGFLFTISFPDKVATIQTETEDGALQFNPVKMAIKEAIELIPPEGFNDQPENRNETLQEKLKALEKQMDKRAYLAARRKLQDDIKDKIERWLKDDYVTNGLEPTKNEMLDLVDDMITRLETLAQEGS